MKVHEEFIEFFATNAKTEKLLFFKPSEESYKRVRFLIELEKEETISREEKAELDDFMKLEHLMRLTKARARKYAQAG